MINTLANFLGEVLRVIILLMVLRAVLNIVLRGRLNRGKQQRMFNPKGHYDYKIYKMKLARIRYAKFKRRTKKVYTYLVKTLQFIKLKFAEHRIKSSNEEVPTIWTDFTCMQEESMIGTMEKPIIPYWTDNTCMQEEMLIDTAPVYVPLVVTSGFRVSHDLL